MAKYNVKYVCGHEAMVDLFGKMKLREWRLSQMAVSPCPECWKEDQHALAEEKAKAMGIRADDLPALLGSEKQIAWSKDIRITKLEEIRVLQENFVNHTGPFAHMTYDDGQVTTIKNRIQIAMRWLATVQDSRFWIDKRDDSAEQIIAVAYKMEVSN